MYLYQVPEKLKVVLYSFFWFSWVLDWRYYWVTSLRTSWPWLNSFVNWTPIPQESMSSQFDIFDHANSAPTKTSLSRSGWLKMTRMGPSCSGSVRQWINAPFGLMFFASPPMHPCWVMTIAGQSTTVLEYDRLSFTSIAFTHVRVPNPWILAGWECD